MSFLIVFLLLLPVLVLVAELLARWWFQHEGAYYVFPPGLRLRLYPDREVLPELEPVVRYEINAVGERGGELPRVEPGKKLYRVLVVGGSQPEGYFLDQDTTWPGALNAILATPEHLEALGAAKVHVGSIARSGVGSEALDLILTRVLPRYPRLQAIIVLVGVSDVLRWLEQGAPPAPPSPSTTADMFTCHPEGPFRWHHRELAVAELVLRLRRRWLRPVQVHDRAGKWIGRARSMRADAKVIRATMPDAAPMLAHFETNFRRALQRANTHADRVLVVRQSWFAKDTYTAEEAAHMWHGGAGQAWREDLTTYYSIEVTSRLLELMDRCASRVATELEVEQLHLMPILEPSLRTYYDFFHLTPAGSKAVATAVASTILRRPVNAAEEPTFSRCADLQAS